MHLVSFFFFNKTVAEYLAFGKNFTFFVIPAYVEDAPWRAGIFLSIEDK